MLIRFPIMYYGKMTQIKSLFLYEALKTVIISKKSWMFHRLRALISRVCIIQIKYRNHCD